MLSSENTGVEYKLKALITFADSLVDGQEYRRAIVSDYLNVLSMGNISRDVLRVEINFY